MFNSVCAAVAEITLAVIGCAVEVVNIVGAAVSHFNVDGKCTTARRPVETDRPSDCPVCNCRMSPCQPPWDISVTPVIRHARCRHSSSGSTFKAKPARTKRVVTLRLYVAIRGLSIATCQALILMTF